MFKNIISAVLTAVMLTETVNVLAQSNKCGENVKYEYSAGVLKISGSGAMYDYKKDDEKPWDAFGNEIKKVVFEKGVTKVGAWSFYDLDGITSIEFSDSITEIGVRSFYGCDGITYIKMPDSIVKADDGAFNSCTNVVRAELSKNLESIGNSAFMNIPKMRAITIPKKVKNIGNYAFFGCSGLMGIYFEGDVPESIGNYIIADINENYNIFYADTHSISWVNKSKFSKEHTKSYSKAERIPVYINNNEVVFDQQPIISDGRTLVPVRAIFEAMGAEVGWEEETSSVTATKDGKVIKLKIGSENMYINDSKTILDVPAQIVGNRTLVPVRAVSEGFGANVSWNNNERAVYIEF